MGHVDQSLGRRGGDLPVLDRETDGPAAQQRLLSDKILDRLSQQQLAQTGEAAFAARVGQDARADAAGPVRFAPGFFDRIPSSGPKAGAAARFREAAEAVAARRAQ